MGIVKVRRCKKRSRLLLLALCLARQVVHGDATSTPTRLRRRDTQCNSDEYTSEDESNSSLSVIITKTFVKRAVVASDLSFIAYEYDIASNAKTKQYRKIYDEFNSWEDSNDAHLLVKEKGVCYGVFRGTLQTSLTDIFQNLYPTNVQVEGSNCEVRKGFHKAYFTSYQPEFQRKLEKCVKSCAINGKSNKNCPLVLSGHSQGASVAIVASIDLRKYDPATMAFGPLKTITNLNRNNEKSGCTDMTPQRMYNFINASGGVYDDIPYGYSPSGFHVGHSLLVDEGNAFAYTGLNDNTLRGPPARNIHAVELYRTRMEALLDDGGDNCDGSFPRVITQWDDGHWCTLSDECKSSICDPDDNICIPKLENNKQNSRNKKRKHRKQVAALIRSSGSPCTKDSMCASGICFRKETCALASGKLGIGARCQNPKDCDAGRCDNGRSSGSNICSPLRGNGAFCDEDG